MFPSCFVAQAVEEMEKLKAQNSNPELKRKYHTESSTAAHSRDVTSLL